LRNRQIEITGHFRLGSDWRRRKSDPIFDVKTILRMFVICSRCSTDRFRGGNSWSVRLHEKRKKTHGALLISITTSPRLYRCATLILLRRNGKKTFITNWENTLRVDNDVVRLGKRTDMCDATNTLSRYTSGYYLRSPPTHACVSPSRRMIRERSYVRRILNDRL